MEVVGFAASIITVIELSSKIASLCIQYSSAVKNGRSDIERLNGELGRFMTTLHGARELLESPNGVRLRTSNRLWGGLNDCSLQLKQLQLELENKLNHRTAHGVMSRLGFRALKWPLESKEIDTIVKNLERYRDILSLGLVIDQAYASNLLLIRIFQLRRLQYPGSKCRSDARSFQAANRKRCSLRLSRRRAQRALPP
jgi:hypothetical protein